jgi:hypothetical protein
MLEQAGTVRKSQRMLNKYQQKSVRGVAAGRFPRTQMSNQFGFSTLLMCRMASSRAPALHSSR